MEKWEYKSCTYINTLFALLHIELNKWGEKGWELVNWAVKQGDGISEIYECIFKRKIKE